MPIFVVTLRFDTSLVTLLVTTIATLQRYLFGIFLVIVLQVIIIFFRLTTCYTA